MGIFVHILSGRIAMATQVNIKITGTEYGVSEQEQIKELVSGTYYEKNGKEYVIYDLPDGNETIHTTLKIEKNQLELIKSQNSLRTHLKFKQGETCLSQYHTMAGSLELDFNTKELAISSNKDSISIHIIYEISINHTLIGVRRIQIEIEKINK